MTCDKYRGCARTRTSSQEIGAFGPTEGGAAALAAWYIPGLPDAARAEIDALGQAGLNITLPDYQFEAVGGLGDFAFDVDDSPIARASLTTPAQAVLALTAPRVGAL